MKKKTKSYSVIIVSDAISSSKDFVISSKLIKNSLIAVCILLIVFGWIIYDYLTMSFNKEKMDRLVKDNLSKEKKIDLLTSNLTKLEESLEKMEDYKKKINIIVGLTSPYALKEVGSGGEPIANISSDVEIHDVAAIRDALPNQNENPAQNQIVPSDIVQQSKNVFQKAQKTEQMLKFVESVVVEQKVRLAATPSIFPTKGYLTAGFGIRVHPFTGKHEFHNGVDIATQRGNKIVATANGTVLVVENQRFLGKMIVIDHGFGFLTRYGHLSDFSVKEGDRVVRGQIIGYVGNTGRSTAPHLHYEVRVMSKAVNPMDFILD
jgi:murein DD-endopeptidase MepM/ murein hydrolase activator NlpD